MNAERVDRGALQMFILEVEQEYAMKPEFGVSKPYHNFYHGVDTQATTHVILEQMGGSNFFSPLEVFAIQVQRPSP